MSKSNATEQDYLNFVLNGVAMPNYGANLSLAFHTADSGTATSASLWTITKVDKTTSPVVITHTGNTAVWDNRVSGSYS